MMPDKCCIFLFRVFMLLTFTTLVPVIVSHSVAGSVIGSKHDLSSLDQRAGTGVMVDMAYENFQQSCVYCHVSHAPTGNTSGNKSRGQAPLWNREFPVTSYLPYQSPTLDSQHRQPSGVSLACLSCHDGTLAVDRVIKKPFSHKKKQDVSHMKMARGGEKNQCSQCHRGGDNKIEGIHELGLSAFGQNLSDDHPVSINYPKERDDAAFHPEPEDGKFSNGVRLFSGRVECASCHDVHNPDRSPFLRAGVEGSALCLTCHVK